MKIIIICRPIISKRGDMDSLLLSFSRLNKEQVLGDEVSCKVNQCL